MDLRGWGAYGAVYLAEGVAPEATGEVALKLALAPRDDRFPREVGLLSRVSHPCIPRLIDQGQWLSPFGLPHPYVVMEWVDGLPLYVWARDLVPSARKVLGLLAGVARALEAVHAVGGVHRDVKGDNVLVRLEDGRGLLTDFGSSYYRGAATLTWQVFPPGTQPYRSPEAFRFAVNIRTARVKVYAPGPADDLFALGVTAYRLVTGQYPPMREDPHDAESHVWEPDGPGPRPARALNPRCCPELSALISRMLSIEPETRGSARELAEALEQAARESGPEADAPLFLRTASRSVEATEAAALHVLPQTEQPAEEIEAAAEHAVPQLPRSATEAGAIPRELLPQAEEDAKAISKGILPADSRPVEPETAPQHISRKTPRPVGVEAAPLHIDSSASGGVWRSCLAAGLGVLLALGAIWGLSPSGREDPSEERLAEQEESRDAGTVAAGDSALTASVGSAHAPATWMPIALDMPSNPFPGQVRPDARGRCPRKPPLVPINGGCWMEVPEKWKDCQEYTYVYKGVCYQPFIPPSPPATSTPTEARDGG